MTDLSSFEQRLQELRRPLRRTPPLDLSGPLGDDPLASRGEIAPAAYGDAAKQELRATEKKAAREDAVKAQSNMELAVTPATRRANENDYLGKELQPVYKPDPFSGDDYNKLLKYIGEALTMYNIHNDVFQSFLHSARSALSDRVLSALASPGGKKQNLKGFPGGESGDAANYKAVITDLQTPRFRTSLPSNEAFPDNGPAFIKYATKRIVRNLTKNKKGQRVDQNKVGKEIRDLALSYVSFFAKLRELIVATGGTPPDPKTVLEFAREYKIIQSTEDASDGEVEVINFSMVSTGPTLSEAEALWEAQVIDQIVAKIKVATKAASTNKLDLATLVKQLKQRVSGGVTAAKELLKAQRSNTVKKLHHATKTALEGAVTHVDRTETAVAMLLRLVTDVGLTDVNALNASEDAAGIVAATVTLTVQQFLAFLLTKIGDEGGLGKLPPNIFAVKADTDTRPQMGKAPGPTRTTLEAFLAMLGPIIVEVRRGRRTAPLDLRGPLNDDPLGARGLVGDDGDELPPDFQSMLRDMERERAVHQPRGIGTGTRTDPLDVAPEEGPTEEDPDALDSESTLTNDFAVGFVVGPSFNTLYQQLSEVVDDIPEDKQHPILVDLFHAYFSTTGFVWLSEGKKPLGFRQLVDNLTPEELEGGRRAAAALHTGWSSPEGIAALSAAGGEEVHSPVELRDLGVEREAGDTQADPEADARVRALVNAKSGELAGFATDTLETELVKSKGKFGVDVLQRVISETLVKVLAVKDAREDDSPERGDPMQVPVRAPAAPASKVQRLALRGPPLPDPMPESLRRIHRLGEAFLHDAEVLKRKGDLLFEAAPPVVPVRAFGGGLIDPDIAQEVDDPELAHQLTRWHQLAQAKVALEQQLKKLMVDLQTGEVFDPNTPSAAMVNAPSPGGMKAALAARKDRGVVAGDIINAIGQLYAQMEPALKAMGDTQVRVDNVLFRLKQRERRTAAWRSVTKAMSKEVRDLAAQSVEDIPAKFQARRDAVKLAMDKLLGGMEKFLEPVAEMLEKAYMLAAEERVVTRQYTDINPEVLLPQEESLLQEVLGRIGRFLGDIFSGIAGLFQRMWQGKREVDAAAADLLTIEQYEFEDGSSLTITNGTPRMHFPPGHPFWNDPDGSKGAPNG